MNHFHAQSLASGGAVQAQIRRASSRPARRTARSLAIAASLLVLSSGAAYALAQDPSSAFDAQGQEPAAKAPNSHAPAAKSQNSHAPAAKSPNSHAPAANRRQAQAPSAKSAQGQASSVNPSQGQAPSVAKTSPAPARPAAKSAKGPGVKALLEAQKTRLQAAGASQAKVTELSDSSASLLEQYRATQEAILAQKAQNRLLEQRIQTQAQELASASAQVERAAQHQQSFVPMLRQMLKVLDEFVALDLPFLPQERKARSRELAKLMSDPSTGLATRTRRLFEAYLIEMQYAQHLQVSQGQVQLDAKEISAQLLRVGRVGLYYLALDGSHAGRYDATLRRFVPIEDKAGVAAAIEIAKKRRAPELVRLPIAKSSVPKGVRL